MELLLALFALTFPSGLSPQETVEMERGVEYAGARAPARVAPGDRVRLELYFDVDEPLPEGVSNFLHLEAAGGSDCRVVRDRPPTNYQDGVLLHEVEVGIPDSEECAGATLDVYTGFYETDSGRRYAVRGVTVPDNRIPAASIEVSARGASAAGAMQSFSPSDIRQRQFLQRMRPWWGWIGGLIVAVVLMVLLRRLVAAGGDGERDSQQAVASAGDEQASAVGGRSPPFDGSPWWRRAGTAALAIPAILSILVALDFIKDDAYISFRYAHNLVTGRGLVFNAGEYVEGFTNFLWVLVLAPFEALRLDLFQVTEILGTGLVLALLVAMTWLNDHLLEGPRESMARLWAPLFVATSSSVALWATSGMEQPLAMLLPVVSAYLLWTIWDDPEATGRAAASGVVIGLGCMTRPEMHLVGIFLGLPLVWRMVRERSLDRIGLYWIAGLLGITVPFHTFRLWYYGSLLPNTFYVKTGGSSAVLVEGLKQLHELVWFNHVGFATLLVPFAFLDRRRLREKGTMLGVAAGFMAYMVWVGDDEMTWYRLYLPALPFFAILAALGLRNLAASVVELLEWRGWRRLGVYLAAWAVVLGTAWANFSYTHSHKAGFNGRGTLSGSYHPDIGKFLTRHARPGALVAFQDMGSTPYHAPDLRFLDFIGLVDQTVAQARHHYGLHAFVSTGTPGEKAAYDEKMRQYFHERSPEWAILTTYVPGGRAGRVSAEFSKRPVPATLEPWIGQNDYQFGIYNETFRRRYRHVRTWPRSSTYYLSLFQRRDLWNRKPREVVIGTEGNREVGPDEMPGREARLEEGLKLLGSRIQKRATEGHHFFVTTWWELPGAMREDLNFFIHVERAGYRAPYDHRPGDWMYPADRWEEGEILEDRTLFQIPPDMRPGTYDVYLGAYNRRSGERLEVRRGPDDGNDRLKLGRVRVTSFTPLFDHLIRPTYVDIMRKYPERIVDHRDDGDTPQ